MAAKAIADAIRTSLGPRGMDKMIQKGDGEVLITNDGATILSTMEVGHPTAKMLVELSKSQDVEAGDGTTSARAGAARGWFEVCVLAGALLDACHQLLAKGLHPTTIAEAFVRANAESPSPWTSATARRSPTPGRDTTSVDAVATCLSSKVIAQNSDALAPLAVDAVLGVVDAAAAATVDLDRVKIVKQVGGTVDDTELVDGIVFAQGAKKAAGGPTPGRHERATFPTPTRVANAKIGLIQFCLSAPKTDMENSVVVSDYAAMDRLLREERKHVLGLCKKVKKAGVTVLLIQKSILRDAYNDLSLHFLAKMGILVVADVERGDVAYIADTLGLLPVAREGLEQARPRGGRPVAPRRALRRPVARQGEVPRRRRRLRGGRGVARARGRRGARARARRLLPPGVRGRARGRALHARGERRPESHRRRHEPAQAPPRRRGRRGHRRQARRHRPHARARRRPAPARQHLRARPRDRVHLHDPQDRRPRPRPLGRRATMPPADAGRRRGTQPRKLPASSGLHPSIECDSGVGCESPPPL
ncbi:hypothetical protein AURANDRAFT_70446 [Aureococcus anophagefferens]|uniref:T-complex protein 1 subunit delta n=1 Tax=Aureococcus anophagefferens TaxID=44056 RepID=F0YNJ0_AURAN|nr:hypothetical protein AURANDRAFT_70446 [Aureococcus anophagefferens]EGB03329.1 hypothetical protein AURANDRAFT_70446 [Aureococcus anophagefferens]|eukprot:XP_009041975.1 hypothetical protein AURANDRAFT_70446 [Aureococcus anophagefferens]